STKVGNDRSLINNVFDGDRCVFNHAGREGSDRNVWFVIDFIEVVFNDLWPVFVCWGSNIYLAVRTTWTEQRPVEALSQVRCTDGQDCLLLGAAMREAKGA